MKRMRNLVAVVAVVVLTAAARGQTQAEMNETAAREVARADEAMKGAYEKLIATLDETGAGHLRAAQAKWVEFREAECKFAWDACRDGSIQPLIYHQAYKRLTEARTETLRERLRSRSEP